MKFQRGIDSRPFSDQLLAEQPLQILSVLAKNYIVKGVDISYWQGDIDFSIMKSKVDFVIMRYAYGNTTPDSNLNRYYQGASDAGLAIMGYHYLKAGKDETKHAETTANLLKDYPALYFWGDAEETGGLIKTALDGWLYKYFNKALELTGSSWDDPLVGIYTSPNFWNTCMPRTDWAKKLKLWIAHWTAGDPLLPYDWQNKTYRFHQYSSKGDGHLHGASSTYIDLDGYNGTINDFNKEFDANITPPVPPDSDYRKVRSLINSLRVRNAPSTKGTVKDYMMLNNTTEALEEYLVNNDIWIRIGFKQWSAMKLGVDTFLEYVE